MIEMNFSLCAMHTSTARTHAMRAYTLVNTHTRRVQNMCLFIPTRCCCVANQQAHPPTPCDLHCRAEVVAIKEK